MAMKGFPTVPETLLTLPRFCHYTFRIIKNIHPLQFFNVCLLCINAKICFVILALISYNTPTTDLIV